MSPQLQNTQNNGIKKVSLFELTWDKKQLHHEL